MNNESKPVTIYIDDIAYQVDANNNLLAAVLSQKLNLPYFCWHPSMGSVGACRQCAVTQYQDENDTRGRLVMACTTPITEGMRISVQDETAAEFREQVISAMMTNHPHDCPVCAEGGECHLQDMTVMTGHSHRQYCGTKRTFTNQYLGELVGHEMNRCITCYRCVRFYKDYAGGEDFGVFGSKNQVYFGRQTDGALESEFSGNLVEVCPTGVFTNKVFSAHYTRKWDLQSAPSVCAHCSIGCNTSIGERYGSVRRVMNRYNPDLNGYFLCDRGRFGIGFVNNKQRIKAVKGIKQVSPQRLTNLDVAKALVHLRGKTFIGVGSARASQEANTYLKLIVGKENFSAGLTDNQMAMAAQHKILLANHQAPSLAEIEQSDFILIVGEDITQTSPRMALSVRQALRNESFEQARNIGIPTWQDSAVRTIGGDNLTPLFSLHTSATKLDKVCKSNLVTSLDDIEQCLNRVTELLVEKVTPDDLANHPSFLALSSKLQEFVKQLMQCLHVAKKPLIVSGWQLQSATLIAAINKLVKTVKMDVALVPPNANSVGLMSLIDTQTLSITQMMSRIVNEQADGKKIDGLIILEQEFSNLTTEQVKALRASVATIIVLDHSSTQLSEISDIVMPVAAVSEGDGHYVNYQGVVQRYYQVHAPVLPIMDSWRWLNLLASSLTFAQSGDIKQQISKQYKGILNSLSELYVLFAQENIYWPISSKTLDTESENRRVARQPHRSSGRTSQMANISVHEAKTTQVLDDDTNVETQFSFSMEGKNSHSSADMPFSWAPGWNSNQSILQYQTQVNGELSQQTQNIKLTFKACENEGEDKGEGLIHLWPASNDKPSNNKTDLTTTQLRFNPQAHWSSYEWQSAKNPEFSALSLGNAIFVSKAFSQGIHVKSGDYVVISSEQHQAIAQLAIDPQLEAQQSYGYIDELSLSTGESVVEVAIVSAQDKERYQAELEVSLHQLEQEKAAILNSLKQVDQYIPIRMISGGLDDV